MAPKKKSKRPTINSKPAAAPAPQAKCDQPKFVGFMDALGNFFNGYFDWRGVSTRAEYWWMVLAAYIGLSIFTGSIVGLMFVGLFLLAITIPFIMLTIRRMHDIGKSGWHFYGVEIGGSLLFYILMAFAWRMKIKTTTILTNKDGMDIEAVVWQSTPASSSLTLVATILMIAVSVYLLALLLTRSKLVDNKYRQKI
ncbi:MAG: DUF805 domain-containing protein [Rickettsiales bacterium]|jgi:uncharacterized membrane protein YhaH (DUF805 family)|nr:DUF805 domain-containing protein [Rickettsiales bacterium]